MARYPSTSPISSIRNNFKFRKRRKIIKRFKNIESYDEAKKWLKTNNFNFFEGFLETKIQVKNISDSELKTLYQKYKFYLKEAKNSAVRAAVHASLPYIFTSERYPIGISSNRCPNCGADIGYSTIERIGIVLYPDTPMAFIRWFLWHDEIKPACHNC